METLLNILGKDQFRAKVKTMKSNQSLQDVDVSSFDAVYHAYKRPLWKFIHGRGVPERDAEDVYHDVFLAIAKFLKRESPEDLKKLIFRIARNKVADYFRKKPDNTILVSLPEEEDAPSASSGPGIDKHLLHQLIGGAALSTVQQEALVLHFLLGYSLQEVARIMDSNALTIKSRLFLAKRKIKQHLTKKMGLRRVSA